MHWCLAVLFFGFAGAAFAETWNDSAKRLFERGPVAETLLLPTGPLRDSHVPVAEVDGLVTTATWRLSIDENGEVPASLVIMDQLKRQYEEKDFYTLLDCDGRSCGGFDFRRAVNVVPAPDMFLNLRDFRALSVRRGPDAAFVLVSRSETAAFVQISEVAPLKELPTQPPRPAAPEKETGAARDPLDQDTANLPIAQQLISEGWAILHSVKFSSGSADQCHAHRR